MESELELCNMGVGACGKLVTHDKTEWCLRKGWLANKWWCHTMAGYSELGLG